MSVFSRWREPASGKRDADLDRELAEWVDELAARYEARGESRAEARRRALIETGGVQQLKEAVRDVRWGSTVEACMRDVRYAWRGLRKSPTFALVVVATLSLGIGATTAIFSAVKATLLTPPPYRDSSALVFIWSDMTHAGYPRAPLSGPELSDLRERSTLFNGFAAIWATSAALTGDGDAEQLRIGVVTTEFFSVLGVDAAIGRTFLPDDEPQLIPSHVVLSDALWRRRYGGDPHIVGRRIRVMGQPMTVVGVMPADFRLLLHELARIRPISKAILLGAVLASPAQHLQGSDLRLSVRGLLKAPGFSAAALGRAMQSTLFGTGAMNAPVRLAVSAVLLTSALLACCVPARRASAVDPMIALRAE